VFQYIFCSGGKIKTVEDEAATKDDIEIGDDDMTKDWNHGLMMITKSRGENEQQRKGNDDNSQTHGELQAIQVIPHLATH
jgi:hypothetical protein